MKGVSTFFKTRKDGTKNWYYRLSLPKVNGERQQPCVGGHKTKKEAEKAGAAAYLEYTSSGEIIKPSTVTFADFLDEWIEKDIKGFKKQSTISNYEKCIKNHIKPELGHYRLKDIKRANLQAFINDLFNKGFSPNTISNYKGILTKCFKWAVLNKYIKDSPAMQLQTPKNIAPKTPTRKSDRLYIKRESMDKIFEMFPETSPIHIPLKLGYECGLRLSEVYALVWEDINLDKQIIRINRQIQWQPDETRTSQEKASANGSSEAGSGYWYFTNPKYNSFRDIQITDELTALLRREKERQDLLRASFGNIYKRYFSEYPLRFSGVQNSVVDVPNPIIKTGINKVNFVMVRHDGSYINSRTTTHYVREIKKAIPEDFKFHDLRHTHISILQESGVNPMYIVARTGHKELLQTLDYVRVSDIALQQGRAAVQNLFGKSKEIP